MGMCVLLADCPSFVKPQIGCHRDPDSNEEIDMQNRQATLSRGLSVCVSVRVCVCLCVCACVCVCVQVHAGDSLGQTALHRAAHCGHLQTCRLLLSAGCDPRLTSLQGFSPSQLGSHSVQEVLQGDDHTPTHTHRHTHTHTHTRPSIPLTAQTMGEGRLFLLSVQCLLGMQRYSGFDIDIGGYGSICVMVFGPRF